MEYTQEEKELLFERDKNEVYSSEHYVFHFQSGSLAEKEIATIAQEQELCFAKICAILQIEYPDKIHYYFTSSPLEIGRVFWEEGTPCNGVALCGREQAKIYAVYNESIKCVGSHEDTHLISFQINYPESDFIVEGLAMFMDGLWWGVPNEVWTSYYKHKHPELSVFNLLKNNAFAERGCEVTYPVAGAFTKYLVETFGKEKYLEVYRHTEDNCEEIFASIFKRSFEAIEEAFWQNMCAVDFDTTALEEMLKAEGFL